MVILESLADVRAFHLYRRPVLALLPRLYPEDAILCCYQDIDCQKDIHPRLRSRRTPLPIRRRTESPNRSQDLPDQTRSACVVVRWLGHRLLDRTRQSVCLPYRVAWRWQCLLEMTTGMWSTLRLGCTGMYRAAFSTCSSLSRYGGHDAGDTMTKGDQASQTTGKVGLLFETYLVVPII